MDFVKNFYFSVLLYLQKVYNVSMDKNSKIIDITSLKKASTPVDSSFKTQSKYHSNPIFKKYMVINVRNAFGRFKVSDLFE